MIGSLVLILFTSLQNFIAIKQEEPCLRRKYDDFQKVLSDPCHNIAEMINAFPKQVIFLGDFNSKHKQSGYVKPNKSGQTLVNIAKDFKLFYVN